MVVDLYEIESSDTGGNSITLKQCANRSFSTVGASVQASLLGGIGTPSEQSQIKVRALKAAIDELVALGNHGQVFVAFMTPTEAAAAVTAAVIPNS